MEKVEAVLVFGKVKVINLKVKCVQVACWLPIKLLYR